MDRPFDELRRRLTALGQALRPDAHAIDPLLENAASRAILGVGFGVLCLLLFAGGFPRPAALARRWRRLTEGLAPDEQAPVRGVDHPASRAYALALLDRRMRVQWRLPAGPLDRATRRRLHGALAEATARAIVTVDRLQTRGTPPSTRTLMELHRALRTPASQTSTPASVR